MDRMTQQEKQLLLIDLCARLPYHVRVKVWLEYGDTEEGPLDLQHNYGDVLLNAFYYNKIKNIKPYLRPMTSMTEEEIEEYIRLRHKDCIDVERPTHYCKNSIAAIVVTLTSRESVRYWYNDMVSTDTIDFLNSRHFDWRGLIPKKLGIEAPEGTYKTFK